MRTLLQNLVAGFRLATFLKVSADHFQVSIRQLFWLTLIEFALVIGIGYFSLEDTGYFNYDVVLQALASVTLTLGMAAVLAYWTHTPALLMGYAVAATAIAPALIVYTYAGREIWQRFDPFPEAAWVWPVVWVLYLSAILTRAVNLWVRLKIGKGTAVVGFIVLVLAAQLWLLPQHEAWYPASSHDDNSVLQVGKHEALLYQQPRLLDQNLNALQAQRANVTDLYFIGFAGYGWQDVFMKEVNTVRALFDSRFDTRGRSLTLINNARSAIAPIATTTALQTALARVGGLLDPNEDLLFLFVTSHGSGDPAYVSVKHEGLDLTQLTPGRLKAALDATPIKWKVIVVSACYSGGFIPALRDDNTLVITASSADRNSFGCDDHNNMTDFGRAYFTEALRQTTSFTAAFELARKQIAKREAAEGLTPSQPQMALGKNFAAKWHGRYH